MKKFAILAMATMIAGLSASEALAQGRPGQPGGGGGFGGGMMMGRPGNSSAAALLSNKSVQEELKLSDEDAKEILKKFNDESDNLLTKILGEKAKPGQVRKEMGMDFSKMREMMTKIQAMQKDAVTKAVAVLKEDQKKAWEGMTGKTFTMRNEIPGGQGGNRPPRRDQ